MVMPGVKNYPREFTAHFTGPARPSHDKTRMPSEKKENSLHNKTQPDISGEMINSRAVVLKLGEGGGHTFLEEEF